MQKNVYREYRRQRPIAPRFASNNDKYRAIESFSGVKRTLSAFHARESSHEDSRDALPAPRGLLSDAPLFRAT